ncbi:MAG: sodium:alanine symporter family protein [Clostridia bacterium]|nr:sodium:alanine symporter family protein [Clostridia bacterium]
MEKINGILCGMLLPTFLILAGIFFAFRLKLFYILHPIRVFKEILGSHGGFSSLCVALAGTLGIGNIVGVASAILMGGYGSIFWMWISAFLAMGLKYVEVYLGIKSRRKANGKYYGGAPFYIYDGIKSKHSECVAFIFGAIFAILCVLNSFSTGNLVQTNAVSTLLPVTPLVFGILFSLLGFLVVIKGITGISRFNSILIPILSIFYIALCLFIILKNINLIPNAFYKIFVSAFSPRSFLSGTMGFTIAQAIRYGTSRGLLSNEAGCGTSPCAHASSNTESAHNQACLGIFEVFFDTIVLCTLTALVIIVSAPKHALSPLELVLSAFETNLGSFGKWGVIISCVLFAFATICTQYFYGVESLKFISKSKKARNIFTALFFLVTVIGAIIPMSLMWQISDLILGVMTIFNLVFLLYLNKKVAV